MRNQKLTRARSLRVGSRTPSSADVRAHKPDYVLVLVVLILVSIGLVLIYSLGPALAALGRIDQSYYIHRQFVAVGLSIVAFIVAYKIRLGTWRKFAMPLLVLAILATIVALILPVNPNYPAHRWVRLGGFSFQSIELFKFALVLWLADLIMRKLRGGSLDNQKALFKPLLILIMLVGLVVAGLQKDLGSTLVILTMVFSMAVVAGVKLKKIGLFLVVIGLVGIIAIAISPYRQSRIEAYLKPTMNCQEAISWQACQARISVGSGGFLGLGLGQGVQAYGYLPQAANDSIFAIYAEKFGFVGSLVLIGVYLIMFERIKRSAERSPDEYARLVAVGILAWLVVESFVNIGGMIGIMPIKGITLPFISYGGTSMVFSGAALGLVFQISKYSSRGQVQNNRGGEFDNSTSRRRVGRSRYANNYNRR